MRKSEQASHKLPAHLAHGSPPRSHPNAPWPRPTSRNSQPRRIRGVAAWLRVLEACRARPVGHIWIGRESVPEPGPSERGDLRLARSQSSHGCPATPVSPAPSMTPLLTALRRPALSDPKSAQSYISLVEPRSEGNICLAQHGQEESIHGRDKINKKLRRQTVALNTRNHNSRKEKNKQQTP